MKVFSLSLLAAGALADDFKLVHDRTRALFVSTAPATIAAARAALSSQNATCFWPDIDYFDRSRAVWQPATHIQRLSTMAQALTSYGSPLFDDAALAKGLHCGLSVWLTRKPRFSSANWWWAWIGEELTLQPIYLLLGANRTTPEEAASFYAFSLSSAWWEDTWGGGDNLSDMLRVQLYRGLASGNVSAVAQSFNVTYATIAVMSAVKGEEGIVPDQSYHFHGEQMLSSSYGAGWVCTVLNAFRLTRGTTFTMPQQAVAVLARFLVEGDAMVTFGRRWDWGTQGRGIDRPGTNFGWAFDPPTVLALAEEPGAAPWAAALAQFARSLGGDGPGLVGTRVFWLTDYVAHKRPTWGAAFKAVS
jgi:chondroitin AC lyase